jgi:hypothetical protein
MGVRWGDSKVPINKIYKPKHSKGIVQSIVETVTKKGKK